jgi:hypothetical protein
LPEVAAEKGAKNLLVKGPAKTLSRSSYSFRPGDYHIFEPVRIFNARRKVVADAGPVKSQSAVAEHPAYHRLVDFDCFNFA